MENRSCNFFSNNNCGSSTGGQSSNSSTPAWDFWELGITCSTSSQSQLIKWNNNNTNQDLTIGQTMCPLNSFDVERRVNEGEYYQPTDRHLMSLNLNLGKRNYVENNYEVVGFVMNKRGRNYLPGGDGVLVGPSNSYSTVAAAAAVPRCQVEGCHVALVNSKAYHRRHKVCEMHAKAPKVVVLGLQQRFCQQCGRFHSVSEFDESKRSCRRKLAGHNERRRKSSQDHYTNTRNPSQGYALSLLSSKNDSLISKTNLPARCSGTNLAQQTMENLSIQPKSLNSTHNRDHMLFETHGWGPMNDAAGNLTLNLRHIRNSEYGLLPKEERQEEEGCLLQERWNSLARAHIS